MAEQILESVKSKYGAVAESSLSSDNAGVKAVAEAFGYTSEELTSMRQSDGDCSYQTR
jgi:arsenite methyltransferase